MRRTLLALLIAVAPAAAAPQEAGGLSLDAPALSVLRTSGPGAWLLRAHSFTIGIAHGPNVPDLDDAEPPRCYAVQRIVLDGQDAVLRSSRADARLDCPENYVSLYLPPASAGGSALFVWGRSVAFEDIPAMQAVIASIRLARP